MLNQVELGLTTILKFRKSTSVSGTLDAINVNGVGNELTNQVITWYGNEN